MRRSPSSILTVAFDPLLDPGFDPLYIALNLIRVVASEFDNDLFVVGIPRFLKQYLHNLRVQVLLQFDFRIVPIYSQLDLFAGGIAPTCLAFSLSYNCVESTRRTTTRSIQLLGKRSHACQSMMYPPCLTSSSIVSSNCNN
jgi:hypothetical protein